MCRKSCAFAHAVTYTGPGHATIGTGATPALHGIIGNGWIEPATGKYVYCVADAVAKAPKGIIGSVPVSPTLLLAPTLGDTMKAHLGKNARVVSLSWKDRAAVLMGGHAADLAAWFTAADGLLRTSTWYGPEAPGWLVRFNAQKPCDAYFGRIWNRIGPAEAYAGLVDERAFEVPDVAGNRTLPRRLDGKLKIPGPAFYRQLNGSPMANDVLLDAVQAALKGMALGQDDVPDLLCIGFSANDLVGHINGPRSVEVRDITLRTDRQIARLLKLLDERVGVGRYAVILSADHGIAPAPMGLHPLKVQTGQGFLTVKCAQAANRALTEEFGKPPEGFSSWVVKGSVLDIYLQRQALATAKIDVVRAQDLVARAVRRVRGISAAVGLERALRNQHPQDRVHRALACSAHPARSADVLVAVAPYWLPLFGVAASHGSAWSYDQEVPLLMMGPGIKRGYRSPTSVTPGAGVVVAAQLLGIPKPAMAQDDLPVDVLKY